MITPRIVVLGGSFNPPTIAHFRLMQAALDGLEATLGYFVPSSHGYVRRKMKRTPYPREVMADQLRLDMLAAMCQDDPRMCVSDVEILNDRGAGHTYETLKLIAAQHPGAEVFFIFGADKLKVLPRWSTYDAVTGEFRLLIFSRDSFDPEKLFADLPLLAARRDRFTFLPQPEGTEDVSSTAIRDVLRQGGDPSSLMHLGAAQVLRNYSAVQNQENNMNIINDFHGENHYLSNFYEAPITWEGLTYPNNEAAFQAAKVLTREERLPFTELKPNKAKRLGRQVSLRPDWEDVKTRVMEDIVRAKFTQNSHLAARLLATGDAQLIEGTTWGDTCWGIDLRTGKGENRLGIILMKVRAELKAAQEY